MFYKYSHIFKILKQISFALVLFVIILQPISQIYASLSDPNYELVDIDWEDDTDKEETKNQLEENQKIRPYTTLLNIEITDFFKPSNYFYIVQINTSYSVEILIPPPKFA